MNEELKAGVRVTHPVFGMGTVRAVSGSGPDARITVDFSGGVGQKKLLAGVAKLQVVPTEPATQAAAPAPKAQSWFEILEVYCHVKPGRRPFIDRNLEHMRQSIEKSQFWQSVRERLRDLGNVPLALDSLNGRLRGLIERTDTLEFRIVLVIQHDHLVRNSDLVITRAAFEALANAHLEDYTHEPPDAVVGLQQVLEPGEEYEIVIEDTDPGPLPDRDPKRAPLRDNPKGLRNRPRRRDEY